MKKLIIGLTVSALLSGCAGNTPKPTADTNKYDNQYSMGMNLLRAGGVEALYEFQDTKVDSKLYEQIKRDNSAEHGAVNTVATTAAIDGALMIASTGSFDAGLLWNNFDLTGIAGAAILAQLTSPKHPMSRSHAVMWIPESKAKTAEQAQDFLANTLFRAMNDAMSSLPTINYQYNNEQRVQADVDVCKQGDQTSRYRNCTMEASVADTPYVDFAEDVEFRLVKKPDFVAGEEQMAWVGYYDGWIDGLSMHCYGKRTNDKEACKSFNKERKANFLKNLPEWIYIYDMNHKTKLGMVKQGSTGVAYPLLMPKS